MLPLNRWSKNTSNHSYDSNKKQKGTVLKALEEVIDLLRSEVNDRNRDVKNPSLPDPTRPRRESAELRSVIATVIPKLREDIGYAAFALYEQVRADDNGVIENVRKQTEQLFALEEHIKAFEEIEFDKEEDERNINLLKQLKEKKDAIAPAILRLWSKLKTAIRVKTESHTVIAIFEEQGLHDMLIMIVLANTLLGDEKKAERLRRETETEEKQEELQGDENDGN